MISVFYSRPNKLNSKDSALIGYFEETAKFQCVARTKTHWSLNASLKLGLADNVTYENKSMTVANVCSDIHIIQLIRPNTVGELAWSS